MQTEKFREWLRQRGNSAESVKSKLAAVQNIERGLSALGSPHQDLDAAYSDDLFIQLRSALNETRKDYQNGGNRFRSIFPESTNPLNRIANSIVWMSQYGQFRNSLGRDLALQIDSSETYWFV